MRQAYLSHLSHEEPKNVETEQGFDITAVRQHVSPVSLVSPSLIGVQTSCALF
jgi:hypothetical protein